MKKIVRIIIFLGLITSSCEKFLEEENLSSIAAEDFYITKTGFESLINANYSQLREIYGQEADLFCAGTDLYGDGRDQGPVGLTEYTALSSNSEGVGLLYTECYKAIQYANMALYYSEITEQTDILPQYVGEVKFLRANAYFLLVQTYGGVGIVTDYIKSPVLKFNRNSAQEVYNLIIKDLTDAEPAVSTSSYSGKVNQRAVKNLLGQVYLTRGYESFGSASDFTTAANLFDEVINGQGLTLTFEELWTPGNEMNEEVIFSVQFSVASQAADPYNLGNRQYNYFGPYMGGSEGAGNYPAKTYTLCPTQFAIDLYEESDTRWDATFMVELYKPYYDYWRVEDPSTLPVYYYYQPKWVSADSLEKYMAADTNTIIRPYGSYCSSAQSGSLLDFYTIPVKKFDDPDSPFDLDERTSTRDIILARLGDTYLLAAEAYLKAGNAGNALDRLNVVRARAGVANASSIDIDYILDERGRELLGEYHRWFDLKRTGKLVERASAHNWQIEEANFVGTDGNLKILRPIPQDALDLNQNYDFPQNPAY